MRLKTILNGIEKHAGFVYTEARWVTAAEQKAIEIGIRARANGHAVCATCGKRAPGYDLLGERRFEYVPLSIGDCLFRLKDFGFDTSEFEEACIELGWEKEVKEYQE